VTAGLGSGAAAALVFRVERFFIARYSRNPAANYRERLR
jgi:hypothetical protein